MKILFYAINGVGLGHLNRTIAVAKEIRKLKPKAHMMFITNSVFPEMIEKEDFPYIKLPIFEGDPLSKDVKETRFIPFKVNEKLIEAIIYDYEPDVVVYDTHFPPYAVEKGKKFNVKNVLILRKLKNKIINDYINELKYFDLIALAHSEQEFLDINVPKKLMENIRKKGIVFIGPIIRKTENIKLNYDFNKFNILITAGGGGWREAKKFIEVCINVCDKIVDKNNNVNCFIITGPLYRWDINSINNKNIIIKNFEPNFINLMEKCDLVISQAGYNVCNEIMLTKTPTIIIPRKDPYEDQKERAKWLEQKGIAIVMDALDERALVKAVKGFYKNKALQKEMKKAFSKIKFEVGNERLAKMIIDLAPKKIEKKVKISRKKQKLLDTKYKELKKVEERLVLMFKEKGLWEKWDVLLEKEANLRAKQNIVYSKLEPLYRELRWLRREKEKDNIIKQKEELLKENKKLEKQIKKLEEKKKLLQKKEPFKTLLKLQKKLNQKFEELFEPYNIKIGEVMEKQELVLEGKYTEKTWNALEKEKKRLESEKHEVWLKELKPIEDKINLSKTKASRYKEEKGIADLKEIDKSIESLWEDIKNNDKKISNLNEKAFSKLDNKIKKIQKVVDERYNKQILPLDYKLDKVLKEKDGFLKKHKLFKDFKRLSKQRERLSKDIAKLQG